MGIVGIYIPTRHYKNTGESTIIKLKYWRTTLSWRKFEWTEYTPLHVYHHCGVVWI